LITLTEAYLGLKAYKKADSAATLSLAKARETNSKVPISLALDNLSKVKAEKKEYESALSYQSQYIAVNDSLETSKTTKEVILNDLHRVNVDNKNLEKRNQTITAKITDYTTTIIIITVLLIIVIILLVMYYKKNLEKNASNHLLQQQKGQIAE